MELQLDLKALAQECDAVLVGKVVGQTARRSESGKMIFTDVRLAIQEWVGGRVPAPAASNGETVLTFAGGQVDDEIVKVSGVPALETGATYVIFTRLDGKVYASPLIGGIQGLFRVVKDDSTGAAYPLTYGRQYIAGFTERDYIRGIVVDRISRSQAVPAATERRFTRNLEAPRAVTAPGDASTASDAGGPGGAARVPTARVSPEPAASTQPPVTLDAFVAHVRTLLAAPSTQN